MKTISCAEHYDNLIDENNDPVYDGLILREYMNKWDGDIFIEKLGITDKDNVLEIGVGTGRIAIRIAGKCYRFTGIDISPKTIERAKRNLSNFSNIELLCEDFLNFNFSNKYDVIYSTLTFLHIKDKEVAIAKVLTLLNKSGKFILSIDKNQQPVLDYCTHRIITYPDNLDQTLQFIKNADFSLESCTETELAYIIVASKGRSVDVKPIEENDKI